MDKRVERIIAIMKTDLRQDFNVSKLAKSVNLSPNRFNDLFKTETGTPPIRYLKSLRMAKAATLLSNSFLSVKQVMARVGFRDESHFARDFKRIYGSAPTQYRLAKRAESKRSSVGMARNQAIGQ